MLENNPLWLSVLPSRLLGVAMSSPRLCEEQWQHSSTWGEGGDAQDVAFFWGSGPFEIGGDSFTPPFPSRSLVCALWTCCESGSPEDLWVAFEALLPFSGKVAHIYSQIALWSPLTESKKSFVHSLPLFLSPLVQTNDNIIPSLFPDLCWHGWLILRIAPMISLWAFVFSLEQTYFFLLYR